MDIPFNDRPIRSNYIQSNFTMLKDLNEKEDVNNFKKNEIYNLKINDIYENLLFFLANFKINFIKIKSDIKSKKINNFIILNILPIFIILNENDNYLYASIFCFLISFFLIIIFLLISNL